MRFTAQLVQTCSGRACALALGCALLFGTNAAASTSKRTSAQQKTSSKTSTSAKTTSSKTHSKSRRSRRSHKVASWRRGQQRIDSGRAREIQEALVREGYLHGQPTGTWDPASQRAMEKFQADNGWQTKVVPDSRALIKLGLGPNHDHLLNPESAMTGPIRAGGAVTAHPADPAGTPAIAPVADGGAASQPQK